MKQSTTLNFIEIIKHLNLKNITLVVQDWGGLLGLTIPQEFSGKFKRLLIMNTAFVLEPHSSPIFTEWTNDVMASDNEENGKGLAAFMKKYAPTLTTEEAQAYAAPFPNATYKAGVRKFPRMVSSPCSSTINISSKAVEFWQNQWQGPVFMAIGMKDKMLGPEIMNWMSTIIKPGNTPLEITEGGHFVQELGEEIAIKALDFFEK